MSRTVNCETCCGEGTVIEFRRFAGEYMAGEPVEVECPDCEGQGEFDADYPDEDGWIEILPDPFLGDGRSGVLRTEPVPVSALRAPAAIARKRA